jgi:hypothetical protein
VIVMSDPGCSVIKLDGAMEGFCSCGTAIRVGYLHGHPTVLHPLPTCSTFEQYDSPIDYLRAVNDAFQRSPKA